MLEERIRPPKKAKDAFPTPELDDRRKQLIDAAKKRAVAQHSDYETFKNMVSVAHLRPLGDAGTRQGVQESVWTLSRTKLPHGCLQVGKDLGGDESLKTLIGSEGWKN
jgi:hypothetical protein